jgi:ribosomal protein S18 acetylase RimI-like enzyme
MMKNSTQLSALAKPSYSVANKFSVSLSAYDISVQIALLLNTNNRLTRIHTPETILHSAIEYFIELNGSIVVGCVGLIRAAPMDKIVHLSVKRDYQHQGVGKKLLNTVLTNSNHDILYMTVREDNSQCLNLVKLYGFVPVAYIPKISYNILSMCLFRRL